MKFTKQYTDWDELPLVLDIRTACTILKCGEVTARKLMQTGKIKGGQGDRKWFIDRDSLRDFVQGKMNAYTGAPVN